MRGTERRNTYYLGDFKAGVTKRTKHSSTYLQSQVSGHQNKALKRLVKRENEKKEERERMKERDKRRGRGSAMSNLYEST